ncbi:hypothetical protein [Mycobacterium sp.]|jgi:uncharacterized membrane protein|uniref:hypothetical protein n=1 Tax=Mycobacterium sp. TaxID=1785 RepID=UPI002D324F15|nr:hypothetical protein [Mycobacterium sp.]HZA11432.1 hypothetical protein [Mycobacterium sp.]
MNGIEEPKRPRDGVVRRAEQIAVDAEAHLPAWLRPGNAESRLPVLVALITAIVMQRAIPQRYTLVPRWPLITMELLLLAVLLVINPVRIKRSTKLGKTASFVLLAAITADNTASAAILDYHIVTGKVSNDAAILLGSGAAVFLTNIIVFGIWYWELDRGGPFRRLGSDPDHPKPRFPDFLFPQMTTAKVAPEKWEPRFVDYLYVSITNVMAFSPTDTMPLTHRAKAMMTLQAVVAVSTIALVFARAVNVLR